MHFLRPSSLLEQDSIVPYLLYRLSPSFWRFSLRQLDAFPFYRYLSEDELIKSVRTTLRHDPPLAYWLDNLAHRPLGHFLRVANRADNSESRRALTQAGRLLISSVIRNDTGVRGGIAGIMGSPMSSGPDRSKLIDLPNPPEDIQVVVLRRSAGQDVPNIVYYVLTNTDLVPDDPRLGFIEVVKDMDVVPGYGAEVFLSEGAADKELKRLSYKGGWSLRPPVWKEIE